MKRTIRLKESELRQMISESVKKVLNEQKKNKGIPLKLNESFEEDFNSARDNFKGQMFGFEMKNPEGEWEYGDITYDPNTNTMSCMGVSIEVDPDMTVDQNLEGLYEELMNQGYGQED